MIKLKPIIQHKTYSVAERMILKHIANKAIKRFNEPEISKALNDFIQNLPTISGISMDFTKEINHVNMNFDPIGDKISSKDNFIYACEWVEQRKQMRLSNIERLNIINGNAIFNNIYMCNSQPQINVSCNSYTWQQD